MPDSGLVAVACADSRCGRKLGDIGMSIVGMKARAVWFIRPGWMFRNGILEFVDETQRSEARLAHEALGPQLSQLQQTSALRGLHMSREVDLPVCVRCPHCRRLRFVEPNLYFKRIA